MPNSPKKYLVTIAGPTAVGKTSLSIRLAKDLNTEIISADSRQFFRELNIGTAKPSPEELAEVPHHFINSHSISETYSAGDFERDVLSLLENLFKTHDAVIMTGGSGFSSLSIFSQISVQGLSCSPMARSGWLSDVSAIFLMEPMAINAFLS